MRAELSWPHFRIISRIESAEERVQYIKYSIEGNWNTRTLQRNVDSQYLGGILKFPETKKHEASNYIKGPYIFEFLGLPPNISQTETQIESALINHLQHFLMEMGKGFAFVARQQHIVTDTLIFYRSGFL